MPDCGSRLAQFALGTGFIDVEESIRNVSIGNIWGRISEAGSENFRRVFCEFATAVMAEGVSGMHTSEDEIHDVVEAASKEWESTGRLIFEYAIVAVRKPL